MLDPSDDSVEDISSGTRPQASSRDPRAGPLIKLLIAEDDPLIGSFLEKGFQAWGFTTCLVEDGEEAQRLGMTDYFDLMVLDIGLPKRDGLKVLRNLRSSGSELPVVVMTSKGYREAAKSIEACADEYLRKPVHFDEPYDLATTGRTSA